jgi:hypothetical protein
MRLPRAHLRVRHLMIAVAIIALMLWSIQMWRRSECFRQKAAKYAECEALTREWMAVEIDNARSLERRARVVFCLRSKYEKMAEGSWARVAKWSRSVDDYAAQSSQPARVAWPPRSGLRARYSGVRRYPGWPGHRARGVRVAQRQEASVIPVGPLKAMPSLTPLAASPPGRRGRGVRATQGIAARRSIAPGGRRAGSRPPAGEDARRASSSTSKYADTSESRSLPRQGGGYKKTRAWAVRCPRKLRGRR